MVIVEPWVVVVFLVVLGPTNLSYTCHGESHRILQVNGSVKDDASDRPVQECSRRRMVCELLAVKRCRKGREQCRCCVCGICVCQMEKAFWQLLGVTCTILPN